MSSSSVDKCMEISNSVVGMRFNSLLVIDVWEPTDDLNPRVLCRCDCGNTSTPMISNLKSNHTKSCGCLSLLKSRTHGLSTSVEYKTWLNVKSRCTNPNATGYQYYGGRGITICDEWIDSFETFHSDMGPRPWGCSIEREDVNGSYSPGNCRWATCIIQGNNRTNNHRLTFDEDTKTISEWARELGIKPNTICYRIRRGWLIPEALGFEEHRPKYRGVFTEDAIGWLITEIENGATQTACAKVLGIDSSSISRFLKEYENKVLDIKSQPVYNSIQVEALN